MGASIPGVSGAEFRVTGGESFPNWIVDANPDPAYVALGNPMFPTLVGGELAHRTGVAFSTCEQLGSVFLFRVTYFSDNGGSDIPPDTRLQVTAGAPPGSPDFDCPLVTLCDSPAFTKICVTGGEFVINPVSTSCSLSPDPPTDVGPTPVTATWSQIKRLYR